MILNHKSFYKVWGNEFEMPKYEPSQDKTDWSAFYFQHTIDHALRYLTKKWDDGYSLVSLIKIQINHPQIQINRLTDEVYSDPRVPGETKASLVKKTLGLAIQEKLMSSLGELGTILEILDNSDGEFEIIIPHKLFVEGNFKVSTIARFRNHPVDKYLTTHYQVGDDQWQMVKGEARFDPHLLSSVIKT